MTLFQWALLGAMALMVIWVLRKRRGDVTTDAAKKLVEEGALLLDVRTAAEFSSGHLPGAVNVPLGELDGRLKKLEPKNRPIVVYCLSGARSAAAASALKHAGFEKVANLGAMSRW